MSSLFPNFETFDTPTSTSPPVTLHGIRAGTGPPLLLLHGYPQTHHIWHKVAPQLSSHFTVIIPDLRGYGRSSKPANHASPNDHSLYAKSAMARDCVALMKAHGFPRFAVCGHDRGGRVTHKLATDFPDAVTRAMVLDIAPTLAMYEATDMEFATAYWHWFFLIQPAPFPETAILGAPEAMAKRQVLRLSSVDEARVNEVFAPEVYKVYEDLFRDKDGVHSMCEDYRAAATVDLEEQRADLKAERKIKCPFRALWGSKGMVEKKFDAVREWEKVCEPGCVDKKSRAVQSGHYIPEEAPDELLEDIMEFFGGEKSA